MPGNRRILQTAITTVLLVATASGCASVPRRNPVPREHSAGAHVPGVTWARMWGDERPPFADLLEEMPTEELKELYSGVFGQEHNYLAISGGGANGAFGAGLLVGWTEAGTRPEFTMVTGISTGAMIAPFAYLGSDYDGELEECYTKYRTEDFFKRRGIVSTLTSDAAASSAPLQDLIAHYIDQEMLHEIESEHQRGRRLIIGTTNLDAGRPVMWDIGAIASSGIPDADALELVRNVILASASLPGVVPPVIIEVEAGGESYDEMHIDGGGSSQVFLYPTGLDWGAVMERMEVDPAESRVFIIRNARLEPHWEAVDRKLFSIARRSIDLLIRTQGIGDLYRIYLKTQRDGLEYNLAFIPDDFDVEMSEFVDPKYMKQLFNHAYGLAKNGYPWHDVPPGFGVE